MPSCSICLSEAIPKSQSITTSCSHTFCNPCLTKWLLMHTTCPLCRTALGKDEESPQYPFFEILIRVRENQLKGLNKDQCFRRVSSLASTVLCDEASRYTWWVCGKNLYRTTIRRNDTKYTLYVELHPSTCPVTQSLTDSRVTQSLTLWDVWASRQYLAKPNPLKKWQTHAKRNRRIKRTDKKCRG